MAEARPRRPVSRDSPPVYRHMVRGSGRSSGSLNDALPSTGLVRALSHGRGPEPSTSAADNVVSVRSLVSRFESPSSSDPDAVVTRGGRGLSRRSSANGFKQVRQVSRSSSGHSSVSGRKQHQQQHKSASGLSRSSSGKSLLERTLSSRSIKRPSGGSSSGNNVNHHTDAAASTSSSVPRTPSRKSAKPAPDVGTKTLKASGSSKSVSVLLPRTPSKKSMKRTPSSKSMQRTPSSKSMKRTPSSKAMKRTPSSKSMRRTPSSKAMKRTPSSKSMLRTPSSKAMQRASSSKSLKRASSSKSMMKRTSSGVSIGKLNFHVPAPARMSRSSSARSVGRADPIVTMTKEMERELDKQRAHVLAIVTQDAISVDDDTDDNDTDEEVQRCDLRDDGAFDIANVPTASVSDEIRDSTVPSQRSLAQANPLASALRAGMAERRDAPRSAPPAAAAPAAPIASMPVRPRGPRARRPASRRVNPVQVRAAAAAASQPDPNSATAAAAAAAAAPSVADVAAPQRPNLAAALVGSSLLKRRVAAQQQQVQQQQQQVNSEHAPRPINYAARSRAVSTSLSVGTDPRSAGSRAAAHRRTQSVSVAPETPSLRPTVHATASPPTSPAALRPRLLHLKGRRRVRVRQVDRSVRSLRSGDVFILDLGRTLYQWNGRRANRMEKAKALDLMHRIKNKERSTRATTITLEQDDAETAVAAEFWTALGSADGAPGVVADANTSDVDEDAADADFERLIDASTRVWRVATGAPVDLANELVPRRPLKRDDLLADHAVCLVVDAHSDVFVWVGKHAPPDVRRAAMATARGVLASPSVRPDGQARPPFLAVSREIDGGESILFKEQFTAWPDAIPIGVRAIGAGRVDTATTADQDVVDLHAMLHGRDRLARGDDVNAIRDDGTGGSTPRVWRIGDFGKQSIAPDDVGRFASSDSYLVLYEYTWKNSLRHLIYFWQGADSAVLDKGTSAFLAVELDKALDAGHAVQQVRVVQHAETPHFLALMRRRFVIQAGSDLAAASRALRVFLITDDRVAVGAADRRGDVAAAAFLAKDPGAAVVAAELVDVTADALASHSCYLLVPQLDSTAAILCVGADAPGYVSAAAEPLARRIIGASRRLDTTRINAGAVAPAILPAPVTDLAARVPADVAPAVAAVIGSTDACVVRTSAETACRVFHLGSTAGAFDARAADVASPAVVLAADQCVLLDTPHAVFLWVGPGSKATDRQRALATAMRYLAASAAAQRPGFRVYAGYEPPAFRAYLLAWNPDHAPSVDPAVLEAGIESSRDTRPVALATALAAYNKTFSLEQLRKRPVIRGLDSTKLEMYLSDDEFEATLGMSRAEWQRLAEWRRISLKRKHGLY